MIKKIKLQKGLRFKIISPITVKVKMTADGKLVFSKIFLTRKVVLVKPLQKIVSINYIIKPGTNLKLPRHTFFITTTKNYKKTKTGSIILPKGSIVRLQKNTIIHAPRRPVSPDEKGRGKVDPK